MPNINIAIASNNKFYNHSLPILLPSLLQCGIEKEKIHIFCGGCETQEQIKYESINMYRVQYNSFDLTPLVAICEMELKNDYWFLIHDTTKVGPAFKEKLHAFPCKNPDKIALRLPCSMSIGTYKYDYLMSVKNRVMTCKMFDKTPEELDRNKSWFVANEDFILWKTDPNPCIYPGAEWSVYDNTNWYNTNTERRTEYFPSLDIYKNKSNWGQCSSHYTSTL